jgi:hypothetical protein
MCGIAGFLGKGATATKRGTLRLHARPAWPTALPSHARRGEAGVLNETGWLEIDYYFGHPLSAREHPARPS